MANDDVGPITELGATVGRLAGEKAKSKIMKGNEEIAHASPREVADWLKGAMDRLDMLVDEETRTQIMETMGFNCAEINKSHIERLLAERKRFETTEAFLEAEEKRPSQGTRLVREGDIVYQYYDPLSGFNRRCFCSLWRGLPNDQDVSPTWCQCSKGFVMKLWEAYLGRPAEVELVQSCISGVRECKFAIHLQSQDRCQ